MDPESGLVDYSDVVEVRISDGKIESVELHSAADSAQMCEAIMHAVMHSMPRWEGSTKIQVPLGATADQLSVIAEQRNRLRAVLAQVETELDRATASAIAPAQCREGAYGHIKIWVRDECLVGMYIDPVWAGRVPITQLSLEVNQVIKGLRTERKSFSRIKQLMAEANDMQKNLVF